MKLQIKVGEDGKIQDAVFKVGLRHHTVRDSVNGRGHFPKDVRGAELACLAHSAQSPHWRAACRGVPRC